MVQNYYNIPFSIDSSIRIFGGSQKERENLAQYIGRLSASMPSPTLVHPCTSLDRLSHSRR